MRDALLLRVYNGVSVITVSNGKVMSVLITFSPSIKEKSSNKIKKFSHKNFEKSTKSPNYG